jgi:FKBP-type peptidyl-prolyl cis-trans isomerase FkpA
MMKNSILLVLALVLLSCNQGQDPVKAKLSTEDDKTFYAMGYMLGSNLQRLELSDKELAALYKGLVVSAKGEKAEVEMQIYQPKIQEMFKTRMEKISVKQKEGGEKFITDYLAKNKNAKKTESGLVYEIVQEGTGAKPKESDTVEVHYHGTLTNGEVFDSSVERGSKISFPLNRVIKGWTEGLQLIGEGGKIKLVIPADLAYGDAGAPPKIPGGATLIFEVELFQVMKEEAKKEEKAPAKPKKK